MRYWVQTPRYYQTMYATNLTVFKNLLAGGIQIPFPRRDVQILGAD